MLQTKASQKEKKDVFPFIRFVKKFLYSLGFNSFITIKDKQKSQLF